MRTTFLPDKDPASSPSPCPRCAALEAERDQARRILKDLLDACEAGNDAGWLCAAQDAASALLAGIPVTGYEEMERERDALKAEVARLIVERDVERGHTDFYIRETHKMQDQRNSARALLGELAAAVREFYGDAMEAMFTPPEGLHLENLLRRAEAEAGGGGK